MKYYIGQEGRKYMANWGPGIYQNDVGEDIKSTFLDTCKRGKTVEEATEYFIQEYAAEIQDEDDAPDFWLALADVQWKIGHLQEKVKERALEYIEWELQNGGKEYFDASENKKRKEVIKKLQEQLSSPMPKAKKITPYKFYKCEWKIGDVYAYPLDGEVFENTEFYGKYVLFHKIGETKWWPGHIVPAVRMKITSDKKVPSMEELEELKYVPMGMREGGKKYEYMFALLTTSKRSIPSKLMYIGNCMEITEPKNEFKTDFSNGFWSISWKDADEIIMKRIKKWI